MAETGYAGKAQASRSCILSRNNWIECTWRPKTQLHSGNLAIADQSINAMQKLAPVNNSSYMPWLRMYKKKKKASFLSKIDLPLILWLRATLVLLVGRDVG